MNPPLKIVDPLLIKGAARGAAPRLVVLDAQLVGVENFMCCIGALTWHSTRTRTSINAALRAFQ